MSDKSKVLIATVVLFCGCVSPVERAQTIAQRAGYQKELISGAPFTHLIFYKPGTSTDELHVYIEHDGTPWVDTRTIAPDPTPRYPLMLALMALDSAPSLYLGRPCYYGMAATPPCSAIYWTHGRYSQQVVESMTAALKRFLEARPHGAVHFYGHSGGGTLAILLAERFANTKQVITLAGNLDVAGWAAHHGYSPLSYSLDPARRPALSAHIAQHHVIGSRDEHIPLHLVQQFAARQKNARVTVLPGVTHACCWEEHWRVLLGT